ncbi:aminoglycoside phosphotransferase family protein [Psychrobacillus sp. FSL H8-0484]|uniref:aminoglycoside phosphotransferase family protein n=1 Tax=Psychrobacillus sp. FSL H8-0484 TaxID=2921390 RepID=UPI0030F96206
MKYPDLFVSKIIGAFGDEGRVWLVGLDSLIETYLKKWKLQSAGPVSNLSYNYVLKVLDENDNSAILKIGIPNSDFSNEIRTLQAYDGKGCVKLLKADAENGVMLLEHLLPGTTLVEVEVQLAIKRFAQVWTVIRKPVQINVDHPSIVDWMIAFDRYLHKYSAKEGPIPKDFIQLAKTYSRDIIDSSLGNELLHGDLHHENILFSNHYGWLAIDPKGVIGDRYFDLTSFLINQLHNNDNPRRLLEKRVMLLCEELQLDKDRLLKACVVMGTLSACWAVEDNDAFWMEAYQSAQWFYALTL